MTTVEPNANDPSLPSTSISNLEWDIDDVVQQLRDIRTDSLSFSARAKRPVKLPSARAITAFMDALCSAMFPNRLGNRQLADESVDYFVGSTLDEALDQVVEQVARELNLTSEQTVGRLDPRAVEIVRQFARRIPEIRRLIESDLRAAFNNDPAAHTIDEVLICFPGVTAMIHHRVAHVFHQLGAQLIARFIAKLSHSLTAIDIHPGARIKESFFIDTGTGVVIGETVVIGQRVRIYHGVTLGSNQVPRDEHGKLLRGTPRHPIIEDDVVIHSGATLLGRILIGRGSVIGCNVNLNRGIPSGSVITSSQFSLSEYESGLGI